MTRHIHALVAHPLVMEVAETLASGETPDVCLHVREGTDPKTTVPYDVVVVDVGGVDYVLTCLRAQSFALIPGASVICLAPGEMRGHPEGVIHSHTLGEMRRQLVELGFFG